MEKLEEEFLWKIQNGEGTEVKKRIEQDKKLVNTQIKSRYPLHIAADYGHEKIIELLLENGANINQKDGFGITPLLAAIYEQHVKCVQVLLKKGADKSGKSPDGKPYMECTDSAEIKDMLK